MKSPGEPEGVVLWIEYQGKAVKVSISEELSTARKAESITSEIAVGQMSASFLATQLKGLAYDRVTDHHDGNVQGCLETWHSRTRDVSVVYSSMALALWLPGFPIRFSSCLTVETTRSNL